MAGLPPTLEAAASKLLADGAGIVRERGWLQNAAADSEGRVSAAGAVANAASNWYKENYYPGKGLMVNPVPIPGEYIHNYRMKFILWQGRLRGAGAADFYRRDAAVLGEWLSDGDGWCGAVWAAMNRLEGWLTVKSTAGWLVALRTAAGSPRLFPSTCGAGDGRWLILRLGRVWTGGTTGQNAPPGRSSGRCGKQPSPWGHLTPDSESGWAGPSAAGTSAP